MIPVTLNELKKLKLELPIVIEADVLETVQLSKFKNKMY